MCVPSLCPSGAGETRNHFHGFRSCRLSPASAPPVATIQGPFGATLAATATTASGPLRLRSPSPQVARYLGVERPVRPDRERKSSGSETTFAADLTEPEAIEAGVLAMADDVWAWCEKTAS